VRRLFGTDGVRGVANRDLSPELALRLGRALGALLHLGETRPTCVVGRDSRLSGDMLEAALTAGLMSAGVDVWTVGVLPTPAVSHLTVAWGASAGAVISASHNPVDDNGIKFFGPDGRKLPDPLEEEIERRLEEAPAGPVGLGVGRRQDRAAQGRSAYTQHLREASAQVLPGTVVIDAAFGAATTVVREVWEGLAERVVVINGTPDGVRINVDCGSTHPETLRAAVLAYGARLGLAFDGDADRLIAVDEEGAVVDGDHLLLIFARHLKARGELPRQRVAVTVMSNLGLKEALAADGISVTETPVGDRYVLSAMAAEGLSLGGEPSGHIVVASRAPTGDGLLASLLLREALLAAGEPLSRLRGWMVDYPQRLVNLRVEDKAAFLSRREVEEAVARAKARLQGAGRVLIRPSGTEPLVRVMVEAREQAALDAVLDDLLAALTPLASVPR
jgi:phosphoglucosamine mutase